MPQPHQIRVANAAVERRPSLLADALVVLGLGVTLWLVVSLGGGAFAPLDPVRSAQPLDTDPWLLPYYAGRSVLRMFVALAASVGFAIVYAALAARFARLERLLIPVLDILQSVPVLGFLSITISIWLRLFPGSELGVEMASIFAIFTAQAWNLAFCLYQSMTTQPRELDEACRLMRLTKWQRLWRLDVAGGMIPLVWNGMMSFGGAWFFLTASEVISVNDATHVLPGIGSYVAAAAEQQQVGRIWLAVAAMVAVVVGVNFFFWSPVAAWAEKFRLGDSVGSSQPRSVVLSLLRRSALPGLFAAATRPLAVVADQLTRPFGLAEPRPSRSDAGRRLGDVLFWGALAVLLGWGSWSMLAFVREQVGLAEFGVAFGLGLATFARVLAVLIAATLVWTPIGVWIGMNPRVRRVASPIVQVAASFPANFLFPLFAAWLAATKVGLDVGGVLLMALGSQWYILFNVIGGASAIPNDLREASASMGLRGWLLWRRLIIPGVFPSWVTGALTAAGGAWNASIVAEVVSYGEHQLVATGLGAYITEATGAGDFGRVFVGVVVMSVFVVGMNRLVWSKLYRLATTRYAL